MRLPALPTADSVPGFSRRNDAAFPQIVPEQEVKLEKVCRRCRKRRRGAAAVEFAVIAPVFFLMIFGMIEFGRMVMVQQILTNASREGARVAVLDGALRNGTVSNPGVIDSIETYLSNAKINAAGATVTIDPYIPSDAGYGEPVTVTVAIPFSQVSWLPSSFFDNGAKVLSATTVMRRETVQ